jgi:hypothetical protein
VKTLSTGEGLYGDEIWSFKAFNDLRMVKVLGAPTLEPSRTRMPDEWKGFPAYQLKPGAALSFEVIRRGDPDPAPDQLNLVRTWWLDFDGAGFTIHDRIGGTLSRTWHLSMQAPMELGRVAVDGQDQLITLQGDRPSPGVQLRRGQLSLEADSRLRRTSSIVPAIGWDHDFQKPARFASPASGLDPVFCRRCGCSSRGMAPALDLAGLFSGLDHRRQCLSNPQPGHRSAGPGDTGADIP